MSTIVTTPPTYEFFDNYTGYESKKKEVLYGSYVAGARIIHTTPNQEGCESAILEIIDGERTLTIIGYYDY